MELLAVQTNENRLEMVAIEAVDAKFYPEQTGYQ
jgi:hypothetical protein